MSALVVPAPAPDVASESERDLQRWQNRLVRFMTGSLVAMGVIFFAATLWLFADLTERVQYRQSDLIAVMDALPKEAMADRAYREWYVRAVLEKSALEQRFAMQSMVVQGRLWTRVMGFLTGMILCFSGSVFVLGKLREPPIQTSAEGSGLKLSLSTSSPGVFLAFAGTILIGLSLYVPTIVESKDEAVYLPRQVEVVDPGPLAGNSASRDAPSPMAPAAPNVTPAGKESDSMPESLKKRLGDPSAPATSR
jgi:hypothetical protein